MRPHPGDLASVAEQILNFLGDGGHDGVVEQGVQQRQQQRTDDYGDEDLDAGIHIAFGLDVHDRNSGTGGGCGGDFKIDEVSVL